MIKYATAIRTGTASTEAILRRFTKANAVHPAYQAMAEVGRAPFSGGRIDFAEPEMWSHPPKFDWDGNPPAGVTLPAGTP